MQREVRATDLACWIQFYVRGYDDIGVGPNGHIQALVPEPTSAPSAKNTCILVQHKHRILTVQNINTQSLCLLVFTSGSAALSNQFRKLGNPRWQFSKPALEQTMTISSFVPDRDKWLKQRSGQTDRQTNRKQQLCFTRDKMLQGKAMPDDNKSGTFETKIAWAF